tara:strand:- start:1620 stop:2243 length:624 start_codon:yes stop_codon:yes gene_type:complete
MERQKHWNKIYQEKNPNQFSWTEQVPQISLEWIGKSDLPKSAAIIDVGGGESKLIDFLLKEDYTNLTVLDISEAAIHKTKERLGKMAEKVNFITTDILQFKPSAYDLWHDRATFHFLVSDQEIQQYLNILNQSGARHLVLGTFSENGPDKCSGLPVQRYSEESLTKLLKGKWDKINCTTKDHLTPFGTNQNFLFCHFRKTSNNNPEI